MTDHPSSRPGRGVVICGAYGLGNAGDDAVLSAIVSDLRRLDEDMPVTVLTRTPGADAARLGVRAVHPLWLPGWLRAIRRARLFISGGGSLLQDVTSRRSLSFYLFTLRAARRMGCAVQLYGCGVGPLDRPGSREKTARVLNACADAATLRDGESLALLQSMGVTVPRLLLAADPALSLPAPAGERERAAGFALRNWPGVYDILPDLADLAAYIYEAYRLPPVFFCLAPEDRKPARAMCAMLEDRGVPCSLSVDARRVGKMGLLISMRLHGLIFALRAGTPAAGLSYDPKVAAFCREADLPCLSLAESSEKTLRDLADDAMHLDGETLSAALDALRARERINSRTAAQLLAERDTETD